METRVEQMLTVAAAVIEHHGRYLMLKRAPHKTNASMWEFPGGKLNQGETLQQCVVRELKEELGIGASASSLVGSARAPAGDSEVLLFGVSTVIDSEPAHLKDHTEFRWVHPDEFALYPMTQAELALIEDLKLSSEQEISYLGPWSLAKLYGVIYGILGIFMGVFTFVSATALPYPLTIWHRAFIGLSVPFANVIVGGIFGALIAVIYNFLASFLGGIKMRLK